MHEPRGRSEEAHSAVRNTQGPQMNLPRQPEAGLCRQVAAQGLAPGRTSPVHRVEMTHLRHRQHDAFRSTKPLSQPR